MTRPGTRQINRAAARSATSPPRLARLTERGTRPLAPAAPATTTGNVRATVSPPTVNTDFTGPMTRRPGSRHATQVTDTVHQQIRAARHPAPEQPVLHRPARTVYPKSQLDDMHRAGLS